MKRTMKSGSGKDSGVSKTRLTREKIAVLAPTPRARAAIAVIVKPGL